MHRAVAASLAASRAATVGGAANRRLGAPNRLYRDGCRGAVLGPAPRVSVWLGLFGWLGVGAGDGLLPDPPESDRRGIGFSYFGAR
jgi:hypothetical protein